MWVAGIPPQEKVMNGTSFLLRVQRQRKELSIHLNIVPKYLQENEEIECEEINLFCLKSGKFFFLFILGFHRLSIRFWLLLLLPPHEKLSLLGQNNINISAFTNFNKFYVSIRPLPIYWRDTVWCAYRSCTLLWNGVMNPLRSLKATGENWKM